MRDRYQHMPVSCQLCAFFTDLTSIFSNSLCRFPVKRLSNAKEEPQEKKFKKAVVESPSQTVAGRRRIKQQNEEEEEAEEEEEDKADILSQSLQKRDKNIKENKAMVANLYCLFRGVCVLLLCVIPPFFDSGPLCCCLSAGKAVC